MAHQHIYDAAGKQLCCTLEEKAHANSGAKDLLHGHYGGNGHDRSFSKKKPSKGATLFFRKLIRMFATY